MSHDKEKRAEQARRWRAANPDKCRVLEQSRYARDGDKRRAMNREAHQRDKERRNAKRREWYAQNLKHSLEQRQTYRAVFPEKVKEQKSVSSQRVRLTRPWYALLKSAAYRAKKRGIPFTLTDAWAEERWTGACEVSKLPFRLGLRESGPKTFSPSIDQIEAKRGYTPDNCRFVIWAVNALKHDGTDADMYQVAEAIFRNSPVISTA